MKKQILFLLAFSLLASSQLIGQNVKYVNKIYARNTVTRTQNIMYQDAMAIDLQTFKVKLDTFRMDVYDPTGNTGAARPLVIYTHTGSFLPRYGNNSTTGARDDSSTVEICTQLAQAGYVVASISYRLGWNPTATTEDLRKEGIINAAYRGLQDVHTAIRYFKKHVKYGGNSWNIDTTKIAIGGQGTGGYLSYVYASIQRQEEIKIDKFQNFTTGKAMVDDTLWGDLKGFPISAGSVLARANHPEHVSTDAKIAFAIGGAMGDTSWMEPGEIPIIGLQGISDPFAPYRTGIVYVPGTSPPLAVVEVSGAHDVMEKENLLGNNSCYAGKIHDEWTNNAGISNEGIEGLYGFAGIANGSGPWEWWDSARVRLILTFSGKFKQSQIDDINKGSSQANPLMSKTRALRYIDTSINFITPRLCQCLGYCDYASNKKAKVIGQIAIIPNPSNGSISISHAPENRLLSGEVYDLNGRLVASLPVAQNNDRFDLKLTKGVYMVRLKMDSGLVSQKLIIE